MAELIIRTHNAWPEMEPLPVSGLDLDIHDNDILGVAGADNAVQSAWLRMLAGIDMPALGEVSCLGRNSRQLRREEWQTSRTHIAYLSQHTALLSVLPTLENILMPALYHQLAPRTLLETQARNLLEAMNFSDWNNLQKLPAYIDELAVCQAMIARALLLQPRIIFIDNALRILDPRSSARLLDFIRLYAASNETALVLHSHDPSYELEHARRMLFVSAESATLYNDIAAFRGSQNADVLHYLQEQELT